MTPWGPPTPRTWSRVSLPTQRPKPTQQQRLQMLPILASTSWNLFARSQLFAVLVVGWLVACGVCGVGARRSRVAVVTMSVEPGSWQQLDNRFYRCGTSIHHTCASQRERETAERQTRIVHHENPSCRPHPQPPPRPCFPPLDLCLSCCCIPFRFAHPPLAGGETTLFSSVIVSAFCSDWCGMLK